MILRKSRRELERMAAAGSVVARTLALLRERARPGVTTGELDRAAEEFIRGQGGVPTFKGYHGFPASICVSPNDMVVHGIPGAYALQQGDVLSVDVGVTLRGWVADSGYTFWVGEGDPPEEVVRPLARHFGVSGVIATRAQVGPDNRYTGELEFYAHGQQKADAIRALADRDDIDLLGCYAYTDSITDVPMLEAVGHPVAVNPDKDLRHVANEREWEIRDFDSPVRLRSRLAEAVPPKRAGVAAAVVGAVAVAGVLVWVSLRARERRALA